MTKLVAVLLAFSVIACASMQMAPMMDHWLGQSEAALVQQIGAPTSTVALGDSSRVFTYADPDGCRTSYTIKAGVIKHWARVGCAGTFMEPYGSRSRDTMPPAPR